MQANSARLAEADTVEPLSLRKYALHKGVSLRAVQKAIASGRIQTTSDGKIDPVSADALWERNTAPRPTSAPARTVPQSKLLPAARPERVADQSEAMAPELPVAIGGLDYSRARTVSETYRARLHKLEYEERSGKLISRDEVEVAAFNRFRMFRDRMLNIPDRVAAVVAAESDAGNVHQTLSSEIRDALEEFADAGHRG